MSDWIKWHGGKRPVPAKAVVEARFKGGTVYTGLAQALRWTWDDLLGGDIVVYRVVEPAALAAGACVDIATTRAEAPAAATPPIEFIGTEPFERDYRKELWIAATAAALAAGSYVDLAATRADAALAQFDEKFHGGAQ